MSAVAEMNGFGAAIKVSRVRVIFWSKRYPEDVGSFGIFRFDAEVAIRGDILGFVLGFPVFTAMIRMLNGTPRENSRSCCHACFAVHTSTTRIAIGYVS